MSSMEINQVLAQMRVITAQAKGLSSTPAEQGNVDFGNLLKSSIDSVNNTAVQSAKLKQAFELGDPSVSLADVMIASQKSSLSFQAMVNVRNKMVDAYKDIMNMPI